MINEYTPDDVKDYFASDNYCKIVGSYLVKEYPGRRWFVQASSHGGYVVIKNADINADYGMVVHIKESIPLLLSAVKKAAGELLERFNLTRGYTDNMDALLLPRDYKGNVAGSNKGELDTTVKQNIILE